MTTDYTNPYLSLRDIDPTVFGGENAAQATVPPKKTGRHQPPPEKKPRLVPPTGTGKDFTQGMGGLSDLLSPPSTTGGSADRHDDVTGATASTASSADMADLWGQPKSEGDVPDYTPQDTPQSSKATAPPAGPTDSAMGQETQANPKTGATVPPQNPTQESDEEWMQRMYALRKRLQPDYQAEARRYYGEPPQEGKPMGTTEMALSSLGPLIGGLLGGGGLRGARGSTAMLSGLMRGQQGRQQEAYTRGQAYQKNVADLARSLAQSGESDWRDLLTMRHQDITQRHNDQLMEIQRQRNNIQSQRYISLARHQDEMLAFEQFKWANPSAHQQITEKIANLQIQERQLHDRAEEGLGQQRLDIMKQIQPQMLALRTQELGLHRQMVDIARQRANKTFEHWDRMDANAKQRVLSGGAKEDLLKSIEGVQRLINSTMTEVASLSLDSQAGQRALLEKQLGYYQQVLTELQGKAQTLGRLTTAPPGAPPASTTKTGGPAPAGSGASTPAAPVTPIAGMTYAGRDTRTGHPVYRNAQGQYVDGVTGQVLK